MYYDRYLFYSDNGVKRLALGANSQPELLANSSSDVALAVDWKDDRIFFCNKTTTAYAMKLDGSDLTAFQLSTDQPDSKCSAISVHDSQIYYSLNSVSRSFSLPTEHACLNHQCHFLLRSDLLNDRRMQND